MRVKLTDETIEELQEAKEFLKKEEQQRMSEEIEEHGYSVAPWRAANNKIKNDEVIKLALKELIRSKKEYL